MARADVVCIAWAPGDSRPRALASVLGGEAATFFDLGIVWKPLVPLRYAVSAVRTLLHLARRRPRAVVIQAPPVPAALLVWIYARLARARLVIDSHTAAFALSGARVDQAMLPLLAWLAPRVDGLIVTTEEVADVVRGWGGRPLIVHEPPPDWPSVDAAPCRDGRRQVLVISTFARDEPLDEVLGAAAALPEVAFRVTGDLRKLPAALRARAPANVEWTGYLHGADYRRALAEADAIVTLDERGQSVARSAYEAVYAGRPLVTSDWPHLRRLFPYAVTVKNRADSIARGVCDALDRQAELEAAAPAARAQQLRRWDEQAAALRAALAGPSGRSPALEGAR